MSISYHAALAGAEASRKWPMMGKFACNGGFDVHGDVILYSRPDGLGVYQLYFRLGWDGAETQITSGSVHRAVPMFHPYGYYFVFQKFWGSPFPDLGPGSGWYHDLYLGDLFGNEWALVTPSRAGNTGVLQGIFSPAADKICWAELYASDTTQVNTDYANGIIYENSRPMGFWKLMSGDFDLVAKTITNNAQIGTLTGEFYEPCQWTVDNFVVFCGAQAQTDLGLNQHPHRLAMYKVNMASTSSVTRISPGGDAWEEFGVYLKTGPFVFMSSRDSAWNISELRATLVCHLFEARGNQYPQIARTPGMEWNHIALLIRERGPYLYVESLLREGGITAAHVVGAMLHRIPIGAERDTTGEVVAHLPGSRTDGNAFTHGQSFTLDFTVATLPSSDGIRFRLRRQDVNNYFLLHISTSGTLTFYPYVAGVLGSAMITAASAVDPGDVVRVVFSSTVPRVYVNGVQVGQSRAAIDFQVQMEGDLYLRNGATVRDIVVRSGVVLP